MKTLQPRIPTRSFGILLIFSPVSNATTRSRLPHSSDFTTKRSTRFVPLLSHISRIVIASSFQAADTIMKLYHLFVTKDIVLLEINPLTEGADGKIYCSFDRLPSVFACTSLLVV